MVNRDLGSGRGDSLCVPSIVSSNMAGKSPINGGVHRKINCKWRFSSENPSEMEVAMVKSPIKKYVFSIATFDYQRVYMMESCEIQ